MPVSVVNTPCAGLPQEELPLRPLMEVLSVDNVVTLFVAGARGVAVLCCVF